MKAERALSYIGIARKAGRLVIGTPAVCDALRQGRGDAVFAASDISEGTKKRLTDKCAFYKAKLYELSADSETLAHMIGKTGAVAAVMITDAGLAAAAADAVTGAGT